MLDLRSYLPDQFGFWLCEFKGGPWDKLGVHFDELPEVIVMDGHRYELRVTYVGEGYLNEGDVHNVYYDYKGRESL